MAAQAADAAADEEVTLKEEKRLSTFGIQLIERNDSESDTSPSASHRDEGALSAYIPAPSAADSEISSSTRVSAPAYDMKEMQAQQEEQEVAAFVERMMSHIPTLTIRFTSIEVLSMFDSEDEAYTGSEYSSHADQPEPVIGKAGSRGPLTATSVWTEQEDPSIDALDEGEERLLQQATRRALTEMGEANQKLRTQLLDLQQLIIAEHEKVEAATQERDNALLKAKQAADPVKEVGRMAFVGANLK
eukprot:gene8374-9954_t